MLFLMTTLIGNLLTTDKNLSCPIFSSQFFSFFVALPRPFSLHIFGPDWGSSDFCFFSKNSIITCAFFNLSYK